MSSRITDFFGKATNQVAKHDQVVEIVDDPVEDITPNSAAQVVKSSKKSEPLPIKSENVDGNTVKEIDVSTVKQQVETKRQRLISNQCIRRSRLSGTRLLSATFGRELYPHRFEERLNHWTNVHAIKKKLHNFYCTAELEDEYGLASANGSITSLQFDQHGQILAAADTTGSILVYDYAQFKLLSSKFDRQADNVEHLETWSETILRTGTGYVDPDPYSADQDPPLVPALSCKYPHQASRILWNQEDEIGAIFAHDPCVRFLNVPTEGPGIVFKPNERLAVKGHASMAYYPERNLVLSGTTDGRVFAWDGRVSKANPAWTLNVEKESRIVSILTNDCPRPLAIGSSGIVVELDLAKPLERTQAFASVQTPFVRSRRNLADVKRMPTKISRSIHGAVRDESHPCRIVGLSTSGNILSINSKHWVMQNVFAGQSSSTEGEELRGFRPEYLNCLGFIRNGRTSLLHSARKGDERWLDLHDLNTSSPTISLEFHKRLSAVCAHPEELALVYSLQHDRKIRMIGVL